MEFDINGDKMSPPNTRIKDTDIDSTVAEALRQSKTISKEGDLEKNPIPAVNADDKEYLHEVRTPRRGFKRSSSEPPISSTENEDLSYKSQINYFKNMRDSNTFTSHKNSSPPKKEINKKLSITHTVPAKLKDNKQMKSTNTIKSSSFNRRMGNVLIAKMKRNKRYYYTHVQTKSKKNIKRSLKISNREQAENVASGEIVSVVSSRDTEDSSIVSSVPSTPVFTTTEAHCPVDEKITEHLSKTENNDVSETEELKKQSWSAHSPNINRQIDTKRIEKLTELRKISSSSILRRNARYYISNSIIKKRLGYLRKRKNINKKIVCKSTAKDEIHSYSNNLRAHYSSDNRDECQPLLASKIVHCYKNISSSNSKLVETASILTSTATDQQSSLVLSQREIREHQEDEKIKVLPMEVEEEGQKQFPSKDDKENETESGSLMRTAATAVCDADAAIAVNAPADIPLLDKAKNDTVTETSVSDKININEVENTNDVSLVQNVYADANKGDLSIISSNNNFSDKCNNNNSENIVEREIGENVSRDECAPCCKLMSPVRSSFSCGDVSSTTEDFLREGNNKNESVQPKVENIEQSVCDGEQSLPMLNNEEPDTTTTGREEGEGVGLTFQDAEQDNPEDLSQNRNGCHKVDLQKSQLSLQLADESIGKIHHIDNSANKNEIELPPDYFSHISLNTSDRLSLPPAHEQQDQQYSFPTLTAQALLGFNDAITAATASLLKLQSSSSCPTGNPSTCTAESNSATSVQSELVMKLLASSGANTSVVSKVVGTSDIGASSVASLFEEGPLSSVATNATAVAASTFFCPSSPLRNNDSESTSSSHMANLSPLSSSPSKSSKTNSSTFTHDRAASLQTIQTPQPIRASIRLAADAAASLVSLTPRLLTESQEYRHLMASDLSSGG